MGLRTVGVRLTAEITGYRNQLRAAAASTKEFGSSLDQAAKAGKLDKVADQVGKMGLGLVALAGGAVFMAAKFDKAMSSVDAATHASAAELDQLRQAAVRAGADTAFSATEAAKGIEELAKAGVSTADILGGGLKGSLDLAAAGEIGVGEAAETAASAMTQFGLSGKAVPHVADLLAAAAGKAQGSVQDMSAALNQSGLVAAQVGLSIEETTGTLAAFASAGLLGSDAGTSFKTMLLRLAAPTDIAREKMEELGIRAFDASGKFVGMAAFAGNLKQALAGLTDEQRNAALAMVFGQDAIRSSAIVYEQGQAGIQGWIDKTNDSGFAADTAARKLDNLAGDVERLKGSLETLAIKSGSGANDALRNLAQGADKLVNAFADLPGPVQSGAFYLTAIGGASLLAAAGFIKVRSTGREMLTQLAAVGPTGERAAAGIGKASSAIGKAGLVAGGVLLAYEGFKALGNWIDHFSAPVTRDVDKMTTAMAEFAATGKVAGELAKTFGEDLGGLTRDLQSAGKAQGELARLSKSYAQTVYAGRGAGAAPNAAGRAQAEKDLRQVQENIRAADASLANLVNSGNATVARIMLDALGVPVGDLATKFPQYSEAVKGAELANTGMAKGFGGAKDQAMALAGGLEAAVAAGQSMLDVFTQLNGAALGYAEAEISAEDAIDKLTASFKENGRTLDVNTEKGRANKSALLDTVQAAAKAAQAKYEETGSITDANRVYDSYIGQLRKTLRQAGFTESQINTLIKKYAQMPKSVTTKVNADTGKALSNVTYLQRQIKNLKGKTVTITLKYQETGAGIHVSGGIGSGTQVRRWGGITEHAQSGLLNEAAMFTPRTRYAFAEPATGGEAFIPKRGDTQRSRQIWSYVGQNWLGMKAAPQAMMRPVVNVSVTPVAAGGDRVMAELVRGLRYVVRVDGGGDVQKALGS